MSASTLEAVPAARTTMNNEDRRKVREYAASEKVTRHQAFKALGMPGDNPYSESATVPTSADHHTYSVKKPAKKASKKAQPRKAQASQQDMREAMISRLKDLEQERAAIMSVLTQGTSIEVPASVTVIVETKEAGSLVLPKGAKARVLSDHA